MVAYKRSNALSTGRNFKRSTRRRLFNTSKMYNTDNVRRTWPKKGQGTSLKWDPFPGKARATLRYSEIVTLTPSIGYPTSQLFRANSIFDPNLTGIGHQPMGHDTYATIYNHYRVISSIITMVPTAALSGVYGILLADDDTVNNDYDGIREQKTTKMTTNVSVGQPATVIQTYRDSEVFEKGDHTSSALFGSNPSDQQIFQCFYEAGSLASSPTSANFMFSITYEVEMWELKDMTIS